MNDRYVYITRLDLFDNVLDKLEKIIIYGTGRMSEYLYQYIRKKKWEKKIESFCISGHITKSTHHGYLLMSVGDIKVTQNIPIVLGMGELNQGQVKELLLNKGFIQYAVSDELFQKMKWYTECDEVRKIEKRTLNAIKKTIAERDDGILFLTPPYWDVYAPFSAVPSLVAKLRAKDIYAKQVDLGIECFHVALRKEWKLAANIFQTEDFYNRRVVSYRGNPYKSYRDYFDSLWFFKGTNFQFEEVKKRYCELNKVQAGVIAEFYQYIIDLGTTTINLNKERRNISEIICDTSWRNLWETINNVGASTLAEIPPVVGVSVTCLGQLLPACKIAMILRELRPDIKIIMGGSCAELYMSSLYPHKSDLYQFFDYIVVGEGETAILQLYEHLIEGLHEINTIPNMAFVDEKNNVTYTMTFLEDVNTLPVADYSDLNLGRYASPKVMLPYQASRGCHYGFCAFCNHNENYRHNYRRKSASKVVSDLVELSRKYNVQHFQFVDEAIRPDHFESIINEMNFNDEFDGVNWLYYSRVSRDYTQEVLGKAYRNGCRMVMFGVETFNQRLLNFIRKGISADISKYCLKLFHKCGIKTFAWMLCNLPSERIDEIRTDIREAKEYAKYVDAYSVGMFGLERNTDMYKDPEKYNIIKINDEHVTEFDSHYDGIIIDKKTIRDCFFYEYIPFIEAYYFTPDRYYIYFHNIKDGDYDD